MDIRKGLATGVFAAAVLAMAPGTASAENLNPELLVGTCVVCHGQGGDSQGHIPALNDMGAGKIASTMAEFRDGKRPGTIMPKIAAGYTPAQIQIIADTIGMK